MTMFKKMFMCGAALIFMTITAGASNDFYNVPVGNNTTKKVDENLNSVVSLVEGEKAYCTAFFIGNNRFITAGHCSVDSKSPLHVKFQDGTFKFLDVEIISLSNPDQSMPDFSVLEAQSVDKDDKPQPIIALKDREPIKLDCGYKAKVGDEIRVEGFPAGMGFLTTWGKVAGETSPIGPWKKPVIRTNISVAGGNSGGPVFNDKTNKVIGILVGGLNANPNLSLVQPITPVCKLFDLK